MGRSFPAMTDIFWIFFEGNITPKGVGYGKARDFSVRGVILDIFRLDHFTCGFFRLSADDITLKGTCADKNYSQQ